MKHSDKVGRRAGFACVALSFLIAAGMSARFLPDLGTGGLSNPDSYMRLVRLRDMIDGGVTLFGVARDGSGHGALLHWSHLIDSLLCLLALPFQPFLEPRAALHAAALLFGPLNLAAVGFAAAWAAAPFAERKWLFLGAALPALSAGIASYGLAGVVHHHDGVVLAAIVCWGLAARLIAKRAEPAAGLSLGAWAGVGLWLTPENVPLTLMAFGALWLAWVSSPLRTDLPRAIGLTGLSFALVTLLALFADPPAAGIGAWEIDRLSTVFGGLALAIALTGVGAWFAASVAPRRLAGAGAWSSGEASRGAAWRVGAATAFGLACACVWAVVFRSVILQSHLGLDEESWHAMFDPINEMQPVSSLLQGLHFLLTGVLALLIAGWLAVRRRSVLPGYVAVCAAAALVFAAMHVRFAAYPEAAGAIALPIVLTMLGEVAATWHPVGQSFARLATILLFVQVPYLGQLPALTASARAASSSPIRPCRVADAVPILAARPGAVVLTDVNDTPEVLYRTPARTVGSLYHRNSAAFLRMRAAWRVPASESVPPEIAAAEVQLVLGCRGAARTAMVSDLERVTLFDQLRLAVPPAWLRPIAENTASGHVLYEVAR